MTGPALTTLATASGHRSDWFERRRLPSRRCRPGRRSTAVHAAASAPMRQGQPRRARHRWWCQRHAGRRPRQPCGHAHGHWQGEGRVAQAAPIRGSVDARGDDGAARLRTKAPMRTPLPPQLAAAWARMRGANVSLAAMLRRPEPLLPRRRCAQSGCAIEDAAASGARRTPAARHPHPAGNARLLGISIPQRCRTTVCAQRAN